MPNQSDQNQSQSADQSAGQPVGSAPPVISPQMDLPPLPPELSTQEAHPSEQTSSVAPVEPPASEIPEKSVVEPPAGSAAPPDLPPMVGTPKKKFGGGKIIATILGIFLLVGGIGVGVDVVSNPVLYQSFAKKPISRWREIGNPKARQAARDEYNKQVKALEQKQQTGSYNPNTTLPYRTGGYSRSEVLNSQAALNQAGWDCGGPCPQEWDSDVAGYYIQNDVYYPIDIEIDVPENEDNNDNPPPAITTPTPSATASCLNVKAYDETFSSATPLSTTQLSALKVGEKVNFCVAGTASSNIFDKAQFKIGTTVMPETTTKRPGSEDFCQSYTILSTDTAVSVKAKINHATLGWQGESF